MENKIEKIKTLIKKGDYKSVLNEIAKNAKTPNLSGDEELTLLYLKSIVFRFNTVITIISDF